MAGPTGTPRSRRSRRRGRPSARGRKTADSEQPPAYHVELRQFPHQARAFNLDRAALERQVLGPWLAGSAIELEDRRWMPERAKLTIYAAPALAREQMGLGRGWATVTKSGEDVTARLLSGTQPAPAATAFKEELLNRVPLDLHAVMQLAGERYPQARASERLALAEQALWELLHQERVSMYRGLDAVAKERWREVLLSWESWTARGANAVVVQATTSEISRSRSTGEANR